MYYLIVKNTDYEVIEIDEPCLGAYTTRESALQAANRAKKAEEYSGKHDRLEKAKDMSKYAEETNKNTRRWYGIQEVLWKHVTFVRATVE